jgi:molybdopterin-guanine dinucleotide biosynthesis protein A
LGRNKLTEIVGDKTLFFRVISNLALFESEIIVVTSDPSNIPQDIDNPKITIIKDIFPDKGSLGGIYTGLAASKTFYNLVVAGDMPFLNHELLSYFVSQAEGYDLVAFNKDNKFEPLHAVYSKNCITPLENILQQSNVRIIELLKLVKARMISQEEIDQIDPRHLSFFNINTNGDLKTARELVGNTR